MRKKLMMIGLLAIIPVHAEALGARYAERGPKGPGFRFRGQPLPECTHFLITEVGYFQSTGTLGSGAVHPSRYMAAGDMGIMFNQSDRNAWGGSVVLELDNPAPDVSALRWGVMARYRRWILGRQSVNLSLGPMVRDHLRVDGVAGSVGFCLADIVTFEMRIENSANEPAAVYLGGKIGGRPGAVLMACGALAAVFSDAQGPYGGSWGS